MSDPLSPPEPERRAENDRRAEPGPARRVAKPSRSAKWLGIAGKDVALIVGALVAIIAAIGFVSPIFSKQPTVVEAVEKKAPILAKTVKEVLKTEPTPADTSRAAQLMKSPQFEVDRKAFAADLVKTGRVAPARADSIAYYAVRESYINGIPPAVVFGVMLTENSRFISGAMSDVGAVGLMQVYPKIWLKALSAKFGKDLASDSTNLKYGIYILHQYIKSDSGRVTQGAIAKGLLRYNGCVTGSHTPNCKTYPSKVASFVENQAEAMCGDKSFLACIAKPFIAGLMGRPTPPAAATQ